MNYIGEVKRADGVIIKALVAIGALYVDDTGIHASEPGTYSNKESTSDR